MLVVLSLTTLSLQACTPEDTAKGESAPPLTNGDSGGCGGINPVVKNLVTSDGGPVTDSDHGGQQPSIKVEWDMEDEDHDLNTFAYSVWYETASDGSADTTAKAKASGVQELKDGACTSGSAHYSLRFGVNGGAMQYTTAYDFTVIITDMADLDSEPMSATGTTPGPL